MTPIPPLRLGTRASTLAMVQANLAARALAASGIGAAVEIVAIRTRGDEISRRKPRGRWVATDGQFTSDLERRVCAGELDLAVHSLKDLPTDADPDLGLAAILERDDARDCLIATRDETIDALPFGARVGTSSARRAAQLAAVRPDLVAWPIRGNVETRIARVRAGEYDAVLLAAAGLDRLGIPVAPTARLPLEVVLPAPGQGAIVIQCRRDHPAWHAIARADHAATRAAVEAERTLLRAVGGGCLAPLGAFAAVVDGRLEIEAAYEDRDGVLRRANAAGPLPETAEIVRRVAAAIVSEPPPDASPSIPGRPS